MPTVSVSQSVLFAQYDEFLRRKRSSHHTMKNWRIVSTRLDEWLRERGLTAETARMGDFEDYFYDMPGLADSSKGTHLRMVKAAFAYGVRRGTVRDNPVIDIILPDPTPREPRIISNQELRDIRAGLVTDKEWMFFHLLAFTGMRRHEIATLRWDDGAADGSVVRLDTQMIRVLGKGRKLRMVPIHPVLHDCLRHVGERPGELVIRSDAEYEIAARTLTTLTRRLHPEYTPHDYRRTVATSLRRNGVDESVRNRIMGWGAKDMFMRYYDNVADAELHRGILRLYADDPIV